MNILMISSDDKLFENGSAVQQRMFKYGKLCDQLAIIVFTKRGFTKIQLAENIRVYPTNSYNKFFYVCDAYKIIRGWMVESRGWGVPPASLCQPAKLRLVILAGEALRAGESRKWLITTQDPFEAGIVGYLAKKRFKIPWQVQIHTDFLNHHFWQESLKNKIRVILAKRLLRRADSIRVVSDRIKNSLIHNAKKLNFSASIISAIFVIPIYVDIEKIRNEQPKFDLRQKYSKFDYIILTVGRLAQEKNHKFLLDGFSLFAKKFPKSLLLIVGDGPERKKLEAQIKKIGVNNNVIIEGWRNDLISYYKGADLFVFTSKYEGYGLAIVEAMAAGLPVLMTDVGVAHDLPVDMKMNVRDAGVLAAMIENSLISSEIRQRLLEFNQEFIKNFPSEETLLALHQKSWQDCFDKFRK